MALRSRVTARRHSLATGPASTVSAVVLIYGTTFDKSGRSGLPVRGHGRPRPVRILDGADGMHDYAAAALVALDWGTSSCRAYLVRSDGGVLAERSGSTGVMQINETARREGTAAGEIFDRTLRALCADWITELGELPIIASGMIGSDQGWSTAPYLDVPVDPLNRPVELHPVRSSLGTVYIVPGLIDRSGLPGVMRGEETQVVGALLADRATTSADVTAGERTLVLPGTHSKWVEVVDGSVTGFTTHMTGELFALVMSHSIVSRLAEPAAEPRWDAFDRGLDTVAGEEGRLGLVGTLFSARSLVLTGDLDGAGVTDYVSGLIIGGEIRSMAGLGSGRAARRIGLLGSAALCARYSRALTRVGIDAEVLDADSAPRALAHFAREAGLIDRQTPEREPA
ncbi:2-dehydro-3-deoxygalactonokinase [Pseudonocardia nematodicida]|uniref:2-dehydro-3-deoxygalactonokinase n=1 Tax=Pseudonocardia nematodicida TaxID=1206997 RepID=A0ABV1KH45_9PSEU